MTERRTLDRDREQRVRQVFANQAFLCLLGVELREIADGRVELALPFRPDLTQQIGYIHGGAVASLADVAGGFAALTQFDAASEILTVEFKINLLAPSRGERLTAVGEVLKSGRTLTVCAISIFAWSNGASSLCASAQQTLIQIRSKENGR
ncbi:MAG TPA: PaaI family thioesterase [Rhizobiaceae bacterium]|nr:PaaI family thioesterase [Rhizobiaceae bacterium]